MPDYAVTCRTCYVTVWEGDTAPADGQLLLTEYAESSAGTACPSKVDPCPHKNAAIDQQGKRRPATIGDLETLKARLAALEAKVKP